MSSFSAADIAEKKHIKLEKLTSKKYQASAVNNKIFYSCAATKNKIYNNSNNVVPIKSSPPKFPIKSPVPPSTKPLASPSGGLTQKARKNFYKNRNTQDYSNAFKLKKYSCSDAEIAEKKRIALEKLNSKKTSALAVNKKFNSWVTTTNKMNTNNNNVVPIKSSPPKFPIKSLAPSSIKPLAPPSPSDDFTARARKQFYKNRTTQIYLRAFKCSAAEIAEKKRTALEKLKSKKTQAAKNKISIINNMLPIKSSPPKFPIKPPSTIKALASSSVKPSEISIIKSIEGSDIAPPALASITKPQQPAVGFENKASFLNSLKNQKFCVTRQSHNHAARDAAHPYKRPFDTNISLTPKGPTVDLLQSSASRQQQKIAPVFRNSTICEVVLISPTRFEVQPSGYNEQLIQAFKKIPSRKYDATAKFWNFAVADFKLLQGHINPLKPDVVIGEIPKSILKFCSTEAKLAKEQKPFQQEGVCCKTTCEVALISPTRFEVQPSGYNQLLIQAFTKIPSREYDAIKNLWNFALADYKLLQDHINPLKDVVIGVIPKFVLNLCSSSPNKVHRACLESIEAKLAQKLMPFQQEGVCFAISQNGRCMICDEMGLGKTYQAIAVADFYREDWPLLICTTASTRDSWANHIRELLPSIPLPSVQVLNSNQQYIGVAKVLITSYSMMEKNVAQLMERKFGFIIFDKSHNLNNYKAKCTMVADRLAQKAKHVILLSGTPALSRPVELFSQLQMVDRNFMQYIDFTSRYCNGKQTNFDWVANGQSNLKELNILLKLKYMIRRTKAEVLCDFAEKFRETVILDSALVWPSDEVKDNLDAVAKKLQASKGHEREQVLLKFYAQTAEVKIKAVCAYLKELVKKENKFIVFAHHRVMMDGISGFLNKLKVKFIRIDGNTSTQNGAELLNTFQKKKSCMVAVLSLGACNSGITLTAAKYIIFAELTWNQSTLSQAVSRAHRIGQTKPVTCRYLIAAKTADDHIWNMLKAKQDVLNKAGIFCDYLQDATHTMAPTSSNKIEKNFSPSKQSAKNLTESAIADKDTNNAISTKQHVDISKEIENIEDLFADIDDDVFKDIIF